jgi:hypothetical protein
MRTCPPCYMRNLCKGLYCIGEAMKKDGWFVDYDGVLVQSFPQTPYYIELKEAIDDLA